VVGWSLDGGSSGCAAAEVEVNWELVGQNDNVIYGSGRLVVWRGLTVSWLGPLACKVSVLLRVDQV
jgi:hypothetical protein